MPPNDAQTGGAKRARREHILALHHRDYLSPHDSRHLEPAGEANDRDEGAEWYGTPKREQGDEQQHAWDSETRVEHAHHHRIDATTEIAGSQPICRAHCCREEHGQHRH